MKKAAAIVLVLLLGGCAFMFFASSKPADTKEVKPSYTKQQILSLESLGLTKSKEYLSIENYDNIVNPDKVKICRDKYALQFISDQGLALFAEHNNLITGEPSKYIGHLDFDISKVDEAKKEIVKEWETRNKSAKEREDKADREFFGAANIVWINAFSDTGTSYIVAPKEMFQLEDGDKIVDNKIVPRDPMLIHSLPEGGYVVLAKW